MDKSDIVSGFLLELRRGTVVLCVLTMLKEPTYGYNLISRLSDTGIAIEGNTLYPLLRRLEEQGLLESIWNTDGAKPRKYYSTTAFGSEVLTELKRHWDTVSQSMTKLLEEK
ncbi:MAG: PadR family transcriptional regulator [Oscillospiraceae bacterium]|jgi:DNA-binding PadR family transcriptional regulator|nr:PadR family transcriptional regulator [Oscillospiraceae bacterium]